MTDPLDTARRVLTTERDALDHLARTLDSGFAEVVDRLSALEGRVVCAGVGKSGHVARKIAATLASTGTPSLYLHPTEASHGDMGMIQPGDAVIALSRSGETSELADLIAYCTRFGVPLIAMTATPNSTLGKAASLHLVIPDAPEACATTRAPTTSTTLQMALGDALAVALLEARGFSASDFHVFHPGGKLGAQLLTLDRVMHRDLPLVPVTASVGEALEQLSAHGFGCVGMVEDGKLAGMVTDGDLRRHMDGLKLATPVAEIMTARPVTARCGDLASDTLRRMTSGTPKVQQLFVVEDGRPVGLVHLHDLLRVGVA